MLPAKRSNVSVIVFKCFRFSVQMFPAECSHNPDKVFKSRRNMQRKQLFPVLSL